MRRLITFRSLIALATVIVVTVSLALSWDRYAPRVAAQSSCVQPPSGMVSWWPAGGHTFDIQDGNHATLSGNPTFVTGKVAQGFGFDGVDDYVRIPAAANLNVGASIGFTMDAWIRPDDGAARPIFEYNNEVGAWGVHFWSNYPSVGALYANIVDTSGIGHTIQTTPGTLTMGIFQHVALTYDRSTGVARLYVNGTEEANASLGVFTPQTTHPLFLGYRGSGCCGIGRFKGVIDEADVFNRALTASEIQSIFYADSAGKCKPFTYPLDSKATFLRTNSDNPAAPLIVDLASVGFAPGEQIKIRFAAQGFSFFGCSGPFATLSQIGMNAVFSNSTTLLAPTNQFRVTGAIDSGVDIFTSNTHFGGQPTDIPQDFWVAQTVGTIVQIPTGATHLFVGLIDSYYQDNCGNFLILIERVNRPPVAVCQNVTVSAGANCIADASIDNGSSDPDGNAITLTQSPAGPYALGSRTVTLTVTDSSGASSSCSATVTVVDSTPPQVTPPANASYQCLSNVPPGNPSQATAIDNCGTATVTVADASNGGAGSISSPLVISRLFTATDGAGNSASAYQTITVIDNTPPVPDLTALPDVNGQCSATISAAPTATDNCRGSVSGTTTDPVSYTTQGTFIVTWTFADGNGNSSTQTQRVIVSDSTAPSIATANKTVNTDPNLCSAAVAHGTTAADNCALASLVGVRSDGALLTAAYPKGMTTINWTATDQAGNTKTETQTITVVDNQQPVIACQPNIALDGNISGSCGANVSLITPAATDNCGVGSITGARSDGQPLNAAYPLGLTTITWTAMDAAGNSASCQQTVTVANPAPVVAITGPPTGSVYAINTPVSFTGSFTDNAGGIHSATWTFDSQSSAGTVSETTGEVTGNFTFTAAGVYKVTLTVTDGCGGAGSASTIDELDLLVVIYDPSAGWVTGGGWINSPASAYTANPGLTGKANFGFVSKYQNGATVPTGNTEFQFKAGNLNFSSTSYEWLVIAGARAQYKGSGKINGAGDYDFKLTAIDGQQPGGGGADKFRIRIWDRVSGGLVYDNQLNAPDSDEPTTMLGGGNIVIHK